MPELTGRCPCGCESAAERMRLPADLDLRGLVREMVAAEEEAAEVREWQCRRCHSYQMGWTHRTVTTRGSSICPTCLPVAYTECRDCGGWNRRGLRCGSGDCGQTPESGDRFHGSCQLCYRSAMLEIRGGYAVCSPCREGRIEQCPDCRDWHRTGRLCPNLCGQECSCGCGRSVVEVRNQEQTAAGRGLINGYSFRPRPSFYGTGPLFLGAELEVATPSAHKYGLAELAVRWASPLAYLKEDSSIGGGFEIVTHPMTYQYAMDAFPWRMLTELEEAGASAPSTTGIHVHVSRAGFNGVGHTYRWMKFMYRNQREVRALARRSSNQYAPFTREGRRYVKDHAKGPVRRNAYGETDQPDIGRYQAINVLNEATLEVRVFAGSLKPVQVQAALGLVAASVEYTRTLSTQEILRDGGWEFNRFAKWASDRPEYAPLNAEIGDRVCVY